MTTANRATLSVILCSHNPRVEYLNRTLRGLASQTLDRGEWELIVVDNKSDPALSSMSELDWPPSAKIIAEEKLGLTAARLRGIREASGELLVFVDDDNVLDPGFLTEASRVAQHQTFLGAWSGQCLPEFEQEPPEWTRQYWGNLVIRQFERDIWSNLPRLADSMPCGAGLIVRREVALHYLELHQSGRRRFVLDRMGDSLGSGGDNDLAGCACDIGLGVGLVASLKLTHLIPGDRLTLDYLSRLAEGIHFSSALLDWERGLPVNRRSRPRQIADFIRVIRAGNPHGTILRAAFRGRAKAVDLLEQQESR